MLPDSFELSLQGSTRGIPQTVRAIEMESRAFQRFLANSMQRLIAFDPDLPVDFDDFAEAFMVLDGHIADACAAAMRSYCEQGL